MSHAIDEVYGDYTETLRSAATEHECSACHDPIAVGHRYYDVTWEWEGEDDGCLRCLRCQAIHEHLRTLAPGDMWPDEELNCGEEYEEHWGEAPPPEIAELAFKTGAELQSMADQLKKPDRGTSYREP